MMNVIVGKADNKDRRKGEISNMIIIERVYVIVLLGKCGICVRTRDGEVEYDGSTGE